MRTYAAASYHAADIRWREGRYGSAWSRYRCLAADAGYIYPPHGSADDDRDAESPSQRAVIWRAIEDRPDELADIVATSRSWGEVARRVIGMEERLRASVPADPPARRSSRPPSHPTRIGALL